MRLQHALDLGRIDVLLAAQDLVVGAPEDIEPAEFVEASEIAAAQPATGQGPRRGLGQVQVAFHDARPRSEEHTSELQSLMRLSYAVFCLKKKITKQNETTIIISTIILQQA